MGNNRKPQAPVSSAPRQPSQQFNGGVMRQPLVRDTLYRGPATPDKKSRQPMTHEAYRPLRQQSPSMPTYQNYQHGLLGRAMRK